MLISRNWLQDYIKGDLPTGEEISEKLGLYSFEVEGLERVGDDWIIDIDVLPNRAHDALSYIGIAREVALIFNMEFRAPETISEHKEKNESKYLTLKIENPQLTRRAMKRFVFGIKIGPSPDWLVKKLEKMGQQSINNIVDITNFVMFETGQPVHAFDFDKLFSGENGKKNIIIRNAKKGEKITMLDGKEYELGSNMLVIADDYKALDIAGIKGGLNSGLDADTKNIVISICNFEPTNIRKTSKKLELRTDASVRFEKDIAPELASFAMDRISYLLKEIAKADVSESVLDEYPRPLSPYKLGIRLDRTNKILGTKISKKDFENILLRLHFEYEKINPIEHILKQAQTLKDKPYVYGASVRGDAPNAFDCSSLISYLYAQAGVSIPRTSVDQYVFGKKIDKKDIKSGDLIFINTKKGNVWTETQKYMTGTPVPEGVDHIVMYLGNGKIINSTRYEDGVVIEDLEKYTYFKNIVGYRRILEDTDERYVITVPYYRLDLRIEEDLIEEIGRVYGYENIKEEEPHLSYKSTPTNKEFYYINKIRDILVNDGFSEIYTTSFSEKGDVKLRNALAVDKGFLRVSLEGGVENSVAFNSSILPLLGLREVSELKIFEIGTVFTKKEELIQLVASEDFGDVLSIGLGMVIKDIMPSTNNLAYKLLDVGNLIDKLPEPKDYKGLRTLNLGDRKFNEISQYPFVLRDIAVWVPSGIPSKDVIDIIWKEAGALMIKSKLFDTFEKDNRTSYAFRIVFQSMTKTLTDQEVNKIMKKIENSLNKKDGWEVR